MVCEGVSFLIEAIEVTVMSLGSACDFAGRTHL